MDWSSLHSKESTKDPCDKQSSRKAYVILSCGLFTFSSIYVLWSFISPAFRQFCLPYVPATPIQIEHIAKLLAQCQHQNKRHLGMLIDLGSGDGRVLINLLKYPSLNIEKAHGLEINRPLVWYSRWNAYRAGLGSDRLKFMCGDLWRKDLSIYQTVIIFGVDSMMEPLEQKLKQELQPGSTVITARYPLVKSEPINSLMSGPHSVYVYQF